MRIQDPVTEDWRNYDHFPGIDPETAIDDLNASVPLGRIAEPEDIADVVVFLASEKARYMCGALVEVNGGKSVQ